MQLQKTLGRYQLLEHLGCGRCGAVYKALDPQTGCEVALKVFRPEISSQPRLERRLRAGIAALRRLDHPNLVPILDSAEEDGRLFVALEHFGDGSLRRLVRPGLPIADVVRMLRDVAAGLDAIHRADLVHGGLKPENILLDANGRAFVADAGFTLPGPGESASGAAAPGYQAPEQVAGEPPTARSDVYSFGLIAYELLIGVAPFVADVSNAAALEHLREPFPHPTASRPETPKDLERIVMRCVARDPADRYEDGAALTGALEWLPGVTPEPIAPRTPRAAAACAPAPAAPSAEPKAGVFTATQARPSPRPSAGPIPRPGSNPSPSPNPRPSADPAVTGVDLEKIFDAAVSESPDDADSPARPVAPPEPIVEEPVAVTAAEARRPALLRPALLRLSPRQRLALGGVAIVLLLALVSFALRGSEASDEPPAAIVLRADELSDSTVTLRWNAPVAGGSGRAAAYDLRFSTEAIDELNWPRAEWVSGVTAPGRTERPENFVVAGLDAGTNYWLAIKWCDSVGIWSPISNVVRITTPQRPDRPAYGSLIVQTTPARALVVVDGQQRRGPVATFEQVPAGRRTVRVEHEGFTTVRRTLRLSAGDSERISIELDEADEVVAEPIVAAPVATTGLLYVFSGKHEMEVLLDGSETGRMTPCLLEELTPGEHWIYLRGPGLEVRGGARSARVAAGDTARVNFSGRVFPRKKPD